jgi:hypothetical protein
MASKKLISKKSKKLISKKSKKLISKKSKKLISKKSKKLINKKSKKLINKKSKKTSRGIDEDINEVLKGIAKNIKITQKTHGGIGMEAEIIYKKDDISIKADAWFREEYRAINFQLSHIEIKNLTGYGLCDVISIFMLRKLYNKAVEMFPDKNNVYVSHVIINSEQEENARKCYKKAFKFLGFNFEKEETNKGWKNNDYHHLSFKKENNDKIWEKIEEDLYYTNSRSKIKYTIGTDEIKMEKI